MIQNDTEDNEKVEFSNRCGIFRWRPNFLQVFRNLYLFLAVVCCVSMMQTAISAGYLASQITTLERRFSLDSSSIGLITSFFDIGFIIMAVFVSYFGGQSRIPVWIGAGMIFTSLGAFLMATPEWFSPSQFNMYNDKNNGDNFPLCLKNSTNSDDCSMTKKVGVLVKLVFMMGQFITGGGGSPILSLGPTYIDDHVSPHVAAPLIALVYASSALGPVVGFAVGAITLKYPVNQHLPSHLTHNDPQWIGAWWLGYLFLGVICIFLGLLLQLFPRKVRRVEEFKAPKLFKRKKNQSNSNKPTMEISTANDDSDDTVIRNNYGQDCKDIPNAVKSLLTNKIFVVVTIGVCFELFLVNGFAQFLPKYIEAEYKVSTITACILAGTIIVPAGAFGIFVGGMIMHRWKLNRKKAVGLSISGIILVIICLVLFLTIGCPRNDFAGVFKAIKINGRVYKNLSNECVTSNCKSCDRNDFQPLCDTKTGITYFSPCFAACNKFRNDKPVEFWNCKCIQPHNGSLIPDKNTILKPGECALRCNNLVAFIVFVVLALLFTGVTQNPILMVTIRSVKKEERSFALGFQFALMRLFAYVPSPMVFGYAIDNACVHWRYSRLCDKISSNSSSSRVTTRGDCIVTDPVLLTNYLIGLCVILKTCACITYGVLLYVLFKYGHKYPNSHKPQKTIEIPIADVQEHIVMLPNNVDVPKFKTVPSPTSVSPSSDSATSTSNSTKIDA